MQFAHLNVQGGRPSIYFPQDCSSFVPLRDFLSSFDPDRPEATWIGLAGGEEVPVTKSHVVRARPNKHVLVEGKTKSFDFVVSERRHKLRTECQGLSGRELATLRAERGEDAVTTTIEKPILGYSADSPSLEPERWEGLQVLIHEATFLVPGESRGAHSNLPQVLEGARLAAPGALILTHFSSRYSAAEIREAVVVGCEAQGIEFPVHVVFPGEIVRDVLRQAPVWP
jgi:ribonuclease Z